MDLKDKKSKNITGFTLVELITVIAIITILATAVLYVINPSEQFKKSRDSQRISDLNKLRLAISLYVETTGSPIMDNNNNANCADSSTPRIFVSVSSNIATSSAPGLPSGWDYKQATLGSYRNVDATGWVPINFSAMSGGSPLPALPIDPINNFSSTQNYFYAYICKSTGQYELETYLESKTYDFSGPYDKTSTDGGRDPYMFETGSNYSLSPLSPVGAWLMNEGSGSYAYDTSGNNNTGTLSGTTTPAWLSGSSCKEGSCLSFSNGYVDAGNSSRLNITSTISITAWEQTSYTSNQQTIISKIDTNSPWNGYAVDLGGNGSCGGSNGGLSYWPGNYPTYSWVCSNSSNYNNGSWHYITIVSSSTSVSFYKDGIFDGSVTVGTRTNNSSNNFWIGQQQGSGIPRLFNGLMDDVIIYNRVLSSAEILQQYNTLK